VDKKKEPCIYDCQAKHEEVHQRQCMNWGARFSSLSQAEIEIPAYTMELGCYLKQMMDGGFGPYASH
jgi:hypothetical protein